MKHVLFRLAAVTLGLMLLAGCVRIVPLAPREEAEQTVLDAICSSVYVDPDADEGEEIAQFIFVGDTLLCEVTETLAAYYAEEIIPDWYTREEIRELLRKEPFAARTQAYCYAWANQHEVF